ncbi:MAG: aminotransferase class V-fold PLP-dependent enzyme [Microthrixaceae bacterium]
MVSTYLDHAATSPLRPEAVAAMTEVFAAGPANPSASHRFGRDARRRVDEARDVIAAATGVEDGRIVFTSGGTEADALLIAGRVAKVGGIVVCSAVEHAAVRTVVAAAGGTEVGVDRFGVVDLDRLDSILTPDVSLVSVMAVNNELGTVQPLAEVAAIVRRRSPGALLHCDAVQAPMWCDLTAIARNCDALSLSGHKFGGPAGVGVAVFPDASAGGGDAISPPVVGGAQERGRRGGTHAVASIAAMAVAIEAATRERARVVASTEALRNRLVTALLDGLEGVTWTGVWAGPDSVVPGTIAAGFAHLLIEGVETEALLFRLDEAGVAVSAASACSSGAARRSHVLAAIGAPERADTAALRCTLGWCSTAAEVDHAADAILDAVTALRSHRARRHRMVS